MSIARSVTAIFKADTKQFESGQKKMQAGAKQTKRNLLDISSESSKLAGVAGSAFSSMAAGIGVATASSDQLGLAMIGAGGAMAAAFAAGGPVGLAIAGIATLFGLASRDNEKAARESAKKIAGEYEKAAQASADAFKKVEHQLEELVIKREAQRAGVDPAPALAQLGRRREIAAQQERIDKAQTAVDALFGPNRLPSTAASMRAAIENRDTERARMESLRRVHGLRMDLGVDPRPPSTGRAGEPAPVMPKGSIETIIGGQRAFANTWQEVREHLRRTEEWQKRMYGVSSMPAKTGK